uniref:ATP synthase F0 subunit 8 n=1 Tax=Austrarchaea mascordi TaxID=1028699 RepID=H2E441_9ARAC|nr:ATP synthase F0 subunit 8 [Austrarchaea mascordi]AEX88947.1 ATP synthase F0 subunit 8 [Austrarchaea mascordi]AEX88950.1 ATP synthase F0 subunit 8 [Austrarchaea mascordi]AEX88953.1 ATP synthase F0 subunit 8 [Austrarchaea mascordi]
MPQLSPLFWVFSSLMVMFLLMSMMVVFYDKSVNFYVISENGVCLMSWCW